MPLRNVLITFSFLGLLGTGCVAPTPVPSAPPPSSSVSFERLSPREASQKIALNTGSILVMKQGFGGIVGPLAQKLGFGGNEGTRSIVIQTFTPKKNASLSWKLSTKVAPNPKDPKDVGDRQTVGSLSGVNLLGAHTLYLPGYWIEGDQSAKGASAIWLSQDVFEDLASTRKSTLNFGVLDLEQTGALRVAKDLQSALKKLKVNVEKVGLTRDVYFLQADPEPFDWKIRIDGREVTAQVIKARNWFGEIVVLNNAQNPLLLKVTLNPLVVAAFDSTPGGAFLKNGLGYEIIELRDIEQK